MLVLIDQEIGKIIVYTDSGKKEISFSDKESIIDIAGANTLYYVTSAVEADAYDIVSIVEQLSGNYIQPVQQPQQEQLASGPKYFRSTVKGILVIPNPDAKTEDELKKPLLRFENDLECLHYDEELVKKSAMLKHLIQKGLIKVVDSDQMQKCQKVHQKNLATKAAKAKANEDKQLGSILVNKSVNEFFSDSGEFGDMEVSADGKAPLTDAEEIAKKLGM